MTPQTQPLKVRLARLPLARLDGDAQHNASDRLYHLIGTDPLMQNLCLATLIELGKIAELLDAYRFMAGKVMLLEDTLAENLERFSPEKMALIRSDLDG